MVREALARLASLRLTVTLLAAAMVLIFAGTLAQTRLGVWQVVDGYFRSAVAWIGLGDVLGVGALERVVVPFPGGSVLAGLLIANLLAAHAARFGQWRRRAGIMVLHAGLIVLLAGEFVTGWFAEEGLMAIDVGGESRYVEDIREAELAVVDPDDAEFDRVVAFPQAMVTRAARTGERLRHPTLALEIEVERWMGNARLLRRPDAIEAGGLERGIAREAVADELPRVRGVEATRVDAPAAVVRVHRRGVDAPLGRWLLHANLEGAQEVEGGHGIALRYARRYTPYTLRLLEFRHDKFVGTEIARNFSSRVRLIDPERSTDREVLIWMNNPLRYRGETFYQASYKPDGSGTVLQVVRNPGWLLPYVACGLVGGGMTLHFATSLAGYLRRRGGADRTSAAAAGASEMEAAPRRVGAALPLGAMALGLALAFSGLLRPVERGEYDVRAFGRLPVSADGRVKPYDTVGRNALMVAGGRQRIDGSSLRPTEFLLGLMARPQDVADLPVVRVDHPGVLALLGLEDSDAGRLSLAAIEPAWGEVSAQAMRASHVEPAERDDFQRAVLELHERVNRLLAHAQMRTPYAIPPLAEGEQWRPFQEALLDSPLGRARPQGEAVDPAQVHPAVAYTVAMMTAYHEQDAESFNSAVAAYGDLLRRAMPAEVRRAELEVLFNRASLFGGAMAVYLLAFVAACGSILLRARGGEADGEAGAAWSWSERLRVGSVGLICAAVLVHTVAIALRMYLQQRPPVTNLYSSAVFVGWAAVLVGLWLERLSRLGLAALTSAAIGFVTLVVAHNLGNDGDTMQMMQAVLDSNFWLATHVVTITLGYSASFLAGALGSAYLLLGVFTRQLDRPRAHALGRMIYGVVCFALLLSFVGTVLGGIWADQSWGRFWGWDPKENGAALIVLLNAIILHARWGGMVRRRGVAVLAVAGNIVVAWSWFGTNMLGVGLHSYGFMDSAAFWLAAFVASQIVLMGIGMLPREVWRSGAAVGA